MTKAFDAQILREAVAFQAKVDEFRIWLEQHTVFAQYDYETWNQLFDPTEGVFEGWRQTIAQCVGADEYISERDDR